MHVVLLKDVIMYAVMSHPLVGSQGSEWLFVSAYFMGIYTKI